LAGEGVGDGGAAVGVEPTLLHDLDAARTRGQRLAWRRENLADLVLRERRVDVLRAQGVDEVLAVSGVDVPSLPIDADRETHDGRLRYVRIGPVIDKWTRKVGRIASIDLPVDIVEVDEGAAPPHSAHQVEGVVRELAMVERGLHRVAVVGETPRVVG